MRKNHTPDSGFTLVELVIVMLITSVLAVTAYARLSKTDSQARLASLQSFKATVLSVATMAKGMCISDPQCDIDQYQTTSSTTIEGKPILFTGRYPVGLAPNGSGGLDQLMMPGRFTIQPALSDTNRATYFLAGAHDENHCKLQYSITSAPSNPSTLSITIDSSGC
ncbi:MAG TPA: prepilin-type N-terminal cleavage/methylation domain-containing protein [Methylophilus sp.]|nr:prepilin-type N-terminal cleavage/methylation domain-containing protein [Methylophilus sp.]